MPCDDCRQITQDEGDGVSLRRKETRFQF